MELLLTLSKAFLSTAWLFMSLGRPWLAQAQTGQLSPSFVSLSLWITFLEQPSENFGVKTTLNLKKNEHCCSSSGRNVCLGESQFKAWRSRLFKWRCRMRQVSFSLNNRAQGQNLSAWSLPSPEPCAHENYAKRNSYLERSAGGEPRYISEGFSAGLLWSSEYAICLRTKTQGLPCPQKPTPSFAREPWLQQKKKKKKT